MVGAIGAYGVSSYSAYGAQGLGLQGPSNLNLSNFNAVKLRGDNVQKNPQGYQVQLHLVPEVLQWMAKKIEERYNVKIRNSDIPFSEEELKQIYQTLSTIPQEHLVGVKMIVKNRGFQLNLQDAPSTVFAKTFKQNVLGAYDKENKRIYLFEIENKEQLPSVLKHEIGHAVHCNNMTYDQFFEFTLRSGWTVSRHEQQFIPGNSLYNLGMRKVTLSKEEAVEVMSHFDWDSIRDNKDRVNKFVLSAPDCYQNHPAFKNPYETFACTYEKAH